MLLKQVQELMEFINATKNRITPTNIPNEKNKEQSLKKQK